MLNVFLRFVTKQSSAPCESKEMAIQYDEYLSKVHFVEVYEKRIRLSLKWLEKKPGHTKFYSYLYSHN
ncbi:hypothetical protein Y032_0005g2757 [Ancylostoma ceylanicum]|uniref:Uncharacterized protein n=1 Tax=Ancylostoma ceylanicum TaxID=53326 RepID=A0A016VSS8_9BILA|nr:hypothetical protein Y032_0005g2757 [Ancylostoma ceylanicum]